jgi:hypothetical protein
MHKSFWLIILVFLLLPLKLEGQNFISPKKSTPGITLAIEINDSKDLEFIRNNLVRFYGVQKVRVNGDVDISSASSVIALLDDLEEVQLIRFAGQLNDEDLEKLQWVRYISLYLKNGKEDEILFNDRLGRFSGLNLIFEVVPESFDFLKNWKPQSLSFTAPFVKTEAEKAIKAASGIAGLKEFGISLDKLTDLSPVVRNMKGLQKLSITDNLSWLTEKLPDNLSVLRKNILRDNGKSLAFEYRAIDAELQTWEWNHLMTIFGGRTAALDPIALDSATSGTFCEFVPLKNKATVAWPEFRKDKMLIPALKDGFYESNANNSKNAIYYLGDELAVMIPAGCMGIEKSGKPWEGSYSLKFIVSNTPGRLFKQGYNLDYDSAGRKYQLSPGLVAEIKAVAGNTELQVRDGYFIQLTFLNKFDTTSRFYAWNRTKSKWENTYDYDYEFDDSKIVPINFYEFYAGKKTAEEKYPLDDNDLDIRFEDPAYFYLLEPDKSRVGIEQTEGYFVAPVTNRAPAAGAYILRRGRGLIGLRKELTDKKTEAGIIRFTVYDKTATLFPELKPFENYPLEIESPANPREFSAAVIRGSIYSDVRFVQEGRFWYLDLKMEGGYRRFTLYQPIDKWKSNAGKARSMQAEFIRRIQQFKQIQDKKSSAFYKYIVKTRVAGSVKARLTLLNGYTLSGGMQPVSFKVRSMGIFTWAEPLMLPDTGQVNIRFTDAGGIPLDVKKAWVAHQKPFSYRTYGHTETFSFNITPSKLAYIACQDHFGRVYYITAEQYRARGIKSNSLVFLPMNEMSYTLKNCRELEKLLNIKWYR